MSFTLQFTILSVELYAIKITITFIHDFLNSNSVIFTESLSLSATLRCIQNYDNEKKALYRTRNCPSSNINFSRNSFVVDTFPQKHPGQRNRRSLRQICSPNISHTKHSNLIVRSKNLHIIKFPLFFYQNYWDQLLNLNPSKQV